MKIKLITFILAILFPVLLYACGGNMNEENAPTTGIEYYSLTPKELNDLKEKAYHGDGDAANRISLYYGITCQNPDKARKWNELAARNGNRTGQWNVATYLFDKPDNESRKKAVFWFEKLANDGDEGGLNMMGEAYEKGIGVKKNLKEAKEYYKKAAYKGEVNSINKLIEFYKKGLGGPADKIKSIAWLKVESSMEIPDPRIKKDYLERVNSLTKELSPSEREKVNSEYENIISKLTDKSGNAMGVPFRKNNE